MLEVYFYDAGSILLRKSGYLGTIFGPSGEGANLTRFLPRDNPSPGSSPYALRGNGTEKFVSVGNFSYLRSHEQTLG